MYRNSRIWEVQHVNCAHLHELNIKVHFLKNLLYTKSLPHNITIKQCTEWSLALKSLYIPQFSNGFQCMYNHYNVIINQHRFCIFTIAYISLQMLRVKVTTEIDFLKMWLLVPCWCYWMKTLTMTFFRLIGVSYLTLIIHKQPSLHTYTYLHPKVRIIN